MEKKDSYKQIAKSTSIVGGTQMLSILVGIAKMKILAVLLGPSGVGITGIFQTIIDLVRDATGFGINFSGVKNIAEVSNSNDQEKVARTITVLRKWALGTGMLGMTITIILSSFFSHHSFGSFKYTISIAFLSVILLTSSISASQLALLQGLRKIGQMAKANLIGALFGTLISLPLYWYYGIDGIVPGMILTSAGAMIVSWIYARKVKVVAPKITAMTTVKEGIGMAKLGFFIVINGFVATLSMYVIRTIIMSHLELTSVGYFQSVWTISTLYVNILLHAMLADYFPRLSQLQHDNEAANKLINQQLEVTLLLGTPMLMGMIILAPLVLNVLYSSSFITATPVLKWQMAGSFFTLISWPLGVLYLSKNEGLYCVISETIRQVAYIACVYFGWHYFGFVGLGIGFFIAGAVGAIFVYYSLKKMSFFKFTIINGKYIILFGTAVFSVLAISLLLGTITGYILNIFILIATIVFCFRKMDQLIEISALIKSKLPFKSKI